MKASRYKSKVLLAIILSCILSSCTNDDKGEDFEAFADALIIKKLINGEAKTAIAYYVYGNNSIASAKVIPPGGLDGSVSLSAIDGRKYDYAHLPDSMNFSTLPPISGNYMFEIESAKGEKIQQADFLEVTILNIPEITYTSYNSSILTLTVKWKALSGSDGISVILSDKEGNPVFSSNILGPSATEFHIGTGGGSWISSANIGDDLVLQIQSLVIEEDANEEYSLYNIAGIAIAERAIKWGE